MIIKNRFSIRCCKLRNLIYNLLRHPWCYVVIIRIICLLCFTLVKTTFCNDVIVQLYVKRSNNKRIDVYVRWGSMKGEESGTSTMTTVKSLYYELYEIYVKII